MFDWKNEYAVNIGSIDAQHQMLFAIGRELYAAMSEAITSLGRITIDLLYGDIEDGQPTITRFVLLPSERHKWRCDMTHHWRHVDGR